MRWIRLLLIMLLVSPGVSSATTVEAKGLFGGGAVLIIDGEQKMLRVGASYRGVTLLESSSKEALVEINGERRQLGLSKRIGANYSTPEALEVRLPRGAGGHYVAEGSINRHPVRMLVDTGATLVAMSASQARQLGVRYRQGRPVKVQTASGVADGFAIKLDSVSVGGIEIRYVDAIVNVGDFPREILLGNSYLSQVDLSRQDGVLVLRRAFDR